MSSRPCEPPVIGVGAGASSRRGPSRRYRLLARVPLAAEIVLAYLRTRRSMARLPIDVVLADMRAAAPAEAFADRLAEARHLGSAVTRTLALLPGDTRCLARSLVLAALLGRRGIPAKLVIGTRAAPDFGAHAWVEQDGHPVLDPGGGSFARLVEL